jgi:hypothetical protein
VRAPPFSAICTGWMGPGLTDHIDRCPGGTRGLTKIKAGWAKTGGPCVCHTSACVMFFFFFSPPPPQSTDPFRFDSIEQVVANRNDPGTSHLDPKPNLTLLITYQKRIPNDRIDQKASSLPPSNKHPPIYTHTYTHTQSQANGQPRHPSAPAAAATAASHPWVRLLYSGGPCGSPAVCEASACGGG